MSLEGSWDVVFTTAVGETKEQWTIEPVDGELRVRSQAETGETADEALTVDGDAFSFGIAVPGVPLRATVAGTLAGDVITGTGKLGAMQFGTFEATRSA
jgi:hypothetical protein